MDTIKFV